MNRTARWYLGFVASRNLSLAIVLELGGYRIQKGPAYVVLFRILSPHWWALPFAVVGMLAVGLQIRPTIQRTKGLVIASSFLAMIWAMSIGYGAIVSPWSGAVTAIFITHVVMKDFTFISQPFISTDSELLIRNTERHDDHR